MSSTSLQVGPDHPGVQLQESVRRPVITTSEQVPPFEQGAELQGSAE